jgi:hypothetical protein
VSSLQQFCRFSEKSDSELVETLTDMDNLCYRKDPIDIRTDEKRLQCDVMKSLLRRSEEGRYAFKEKVETPGWPEPQHLVQLQHQQGGGQSVGQQ